MHTEDRIGTPRPFVNMVDPQFPALKIIHAAVVGLIGPQGEVLKALIGRSKRFQGILQVLVASDELLTARIDSDAFKVASKFPLSHHVVG
jgi:hypothetical protein